MTKRSAIFFVIFLFACIQAHAQTSDIPDPAPDNDLTLLDTEARLVSAAETGLPEEPPADLFARDSYRIDTIVCPFKGDIDYEAGDIECGLLEVPENREDLEALPGVGRKTANVLLNTAFGHPVMAVDTHIFRVSNRTGLAPGKTPLAVEQRLMRLVPKEFLQDAHHWLILHGRYTCKARKPNCPECIVQNLCSFADKIVV